MDEDGTANDAEADKADASVALIVCAPTPAFEGTLNVAENDPAEVDVTVEGVVETAMESNFIVTWLLGVKFDPVTFTLIESGPDDGVITMEGTLVPPTVNV